MKLDFSKYPISGHAYSTGPMAFLEIVPGKILGGMIELALIETGNRVAREQWQRTQLRNLLNHAAQRSAFWRSRIGPKPSDRKLGVLPILTRADVRRQVEQEGSLLRPGDGLETFVHGTSGSSGTPVQFHVSQMNNQYNAVRTLAQEFIEGKDLSVNRTRLKTAKASAAEELARMPGRFTVKKKHHGSETSDPFSYRAASRTSNLSTPISAIWCANCERTWLASWWRIRGW
jgi:hypothetical protein